jgi:hypothetical protein
MFFCVSGVREADISIINNKVEKFQMLFCVLLLLVVALVLISLYPKNLSFLTSKFPVMEKVKVKILAQETLLSKHVASVAGSIKIREENREEIHTFSDFDEKKMLDSVMGEKPASCLEPDELEQTLYYRARIEDEKETTEPLERKDLAPYIEMPQKPIKKSLILDNFDSVPSSVVSLGKVLPPSYNALSYNSIGEKFSPPCSEKDDREKNDKERECKTKTEKSYISLHQPLERKDTQEFPRYKDHKLQNSSQIFDSTICETINSETKSEEHGTPSKKKNSVVEMEKEKVWMNYII